MATFNSILSNKLKNCPFLMNSLKSYTISSTNIFSEALKKVMHCIAISTRTTNNFLVKGQRLWMPPPEKTAWPISVYPFHKATYCMNRLLRHTVNSAWYKTFNLLFYSNILKQQSLTGLWIHILALIFHPICKRSLVPSY